MTSPVCNKCDCVKGCQSNPTACPILLAECIASGQVSVAQIEAHRVLDAAIAQPEQTPVFYQFQTKDGKWHGFSDEAHRKNTVKAGRWPIRALYTAPQVAQPEQPAIDIKEFTDRVFRMVDGVKFELEQNKLDAAISARLDVEHFLLKHIAQPEQTAPPESALQSLARRCLWIAYCWNDHNFSEAYTYARKTAQELGINNFDEANEWLKAQPVTTPKETK